MRDRISSKEENINPEGPYTAHHESVNLITPVPRVVRHPLRFEYADDAQYGRDTLFLHEILSLALDNFINNVVILRSLRHPR
jgi:hypothetical protein